MSDAARAAILTLLEARREGATICPSEAARKLDPKDWRARMGEVRGAAASLAAEGRVVVTQKGVAVDVALARGPVRIGRATEGTA